VAAAAERDIDLSGLALVAGQRLVAVQRLCNDWSARRRPSWSRLPRLALSWHDLPGSGWAESRRSLLLSLMVERQRCRFRRNVHHLPINPLHHPPDGLQWYASIAIGQRNLRRHVEP
jgi:hypothetical protein